MMPMHVKTHRAEWTVRVPVETEELWELPRHDGMKTARFIPSELIVTWKPSRYPGDSVIWVRLQGRRRTKSGKTSGYSTVSADWGHYPEGWNEDRHLKLTERGGAIPEWIREFVEANTPAELKTKTES